MCKGGFFKPFNFIAYLDKTNEFALNVDIFKKFIENKFV